MKSKSSLVVLLVLQAIAVILYPFPFFQQAPQAAVLPPTLLILFAGALIAMNTGSLSLEGGRNSLIFVQGINIVVRLMTLFPNLKTPEGDWAWLLLIFQVTAMGLSWYTMLELDRRPLPSLRLSSPSTT